MSDKVVVVGGGIIGLACAYYLRKNGAEVTILEKDEFGNACSKGNQGWVCPALHSPVSEPGLVGTSIKWLMKKDSPLYIAPSAAPRLSGWLIQFMKYCNEEDFKAGEYALLNLSRSTLDFYDSLISDGLKFEMHRKGIMFAFLNEKELKQKKDKMEKNSALHGHEAPIALTGDEVRELEPSFSKNVVGGLLFKRQRHVRPETLSKAFVETLKSMNVHMRPNTKVTKIEREDDKLIAIYSGSERIEADKFLFATGAWSGDLAKMLRYLPPIQAGKGYSITIYNPNLKIQRPLYLGESKVGISPFNGAIRIGGTMELSGINTNMDKSRIQGIRNWIAKYLNEEIKGDTEVEWTGMRPMTPDSIPVLGAVPRTQNAFIATGHGMIGIAMAPSTGKIMSDIICFGNTEYNIEPFDPSRFQKSKV